MCRVPTLKLSHRSDRAQTRNFVLDTEPSPPKTTPSGPAEQPAGKKKAGSSRREGRRTGTSREKIRKSRGRQDTGGNSEDEDDHHPSDSELFGGDDDIRADGDEEFETTEDSNLRTTMGTGQATDETAGVDARVDEDEEPKPKLALELKYRTFSNFNRCLCVIVEPWSPQRSSSRAPSLTPSAVTRASTVPPTTSEFNTSHGQRAKTPLFFPDVDDEPTTPARSHTHPRTFPPVPLFDDPPTTHDTDNAEEWDDSAELMQFSQMLNATGRLGWADVEEEDEFDGMALFADADEAKEL
jgi:hypothetical protein